MTDQPIDEVSSALDSSEEPSEGQLRSQEAARYRIQAREEREAREAAELQNAQLAQRLESLERQQVETSLAGKLADPKDFWSEAKLEDVRAQDGTIDPNAISERATSLLENHPHWAAPDHSLPGGHLVNSRGVIGGRPRNILDGDNIAPEVRTRSWAEFVTEAAQGQAPPTM